MKKMVSNPGGSLLVAALLLCSLSALAQTETKSPVGTWDCVISGARQGVGYLTFYDDFTFNGYEILAPARLHGIPDDLVATVPVSGLGVRPPTLPPYAVTNLAGWVRASGPWHYDRNWRTTGFFTETARPVGAITNATVLARWEGMSSEENGEPPDPHGAAGRNGIIQTVNTRISYFSKSGNLIWGPTHLQVFWLSVTNTGTGLSDPKVIYDRASDKFYVIMQENLADQSWLNVAVSKSGDPATPGSSDWYFYRFDITERLEDANYGGDYPGLGVDAQAVYVTYNMYALPLSDTNSPLNSQIIILDKTAINSGTGTFLRTNLFTPDGVTNGFTLQPATVISGNPGNVAYFAETPLYSQTNARLWAVSDPLGAASLTSKEVVIPDNGGSIDGAPQQGGPPLSTVSPRTQGSASWHKGAVWFCNTAGGDSGQSKVYYYSINCNDFPSGTPVLAEYGTIYGGAGFWTFQPSIRLNPAGDVCIVYTRSSVQTHPTILSSVRPARGLSFLAPLVLKDSSDAYLGTRWGDFAAVSVDPIDGTFWATHEWARSKYPGDWGTWWAQIDTASPGVGLTNNVNFTGKVVPGKKLILVGTTPLGKVTIQGVPAVDLSGSGLAEEDWYGIKKQNGVSSLEFFSLESSDLAPNTFWVSGRGAGYTYSGMAMLSARKRIAFSFNTAGTSPRARAVAGSFNPRKLSANTSGIDTPLLSPSVNDRVTFQVFTQPH